MAAAKGMIFLETGHPIIHEFLTERLNGKKDPADIKLADFGGVTYHILVTKDKPDVINFTVELDCLEQLKTMGVKSSIDAKYGKIGSKLDRNSLKFTIKTSDLNKDLVKDLSEVSRNLLAAPFEKCFKALASGGASGITPMVLPYRKNEMVCLAPSNDRVLVVYSIDFADEEDRAIARVFLQEFAEAQRHVSNAPNVTFSTSPPGDVTKVKGFKASKKPVGYIMFQVFKSHVEDKKLERVCTMFSGFRSYLHYHIKASKSHLHTRMRRRVGLLLKVLNRANPEVLEAELNSRARPFARKV